VPATKSCAKAHWLPSTNRLEPGFEWQTPNSFGGRGSTDFNRRLPQKAALKRTGCPAPTGLSRVLNGRHRIHSVGAAAPIEIGACHKKLR
jgi:hypothetical protein